MLYDPKWEGKTEAKPSLAGLIAWLERQPPDKTYAYWDCLGGCLLDQYLSYATGLPSSPGPLHHDTCGGSQSYHHIALMKPWTFGAALERARTLSQTKGQRAT